ncbi:MAG: M48 family metallopeptidase [Spirochaetales bacterium]|nr:M48 family metallopeptidase [Spirochaetales bacterium]
MNKQKKILNEINPRSWEHPADRAALSALKQIPGLDVLLQKFLGILTDRSLRLIALASSVRISERQYPKIWSLHMEACSILDVKQIPELYISQNPIMNAGAIGVEKPFIMLNSSIVEKLSQEEILSVIGHEVGHCISGHALYRTLLVVLLQASISLLNIPIAGIAIYAIVAALNEWSRKSELSADRAGLLVVQDPQFCYNTFMKLSGGTDVSQLDINEFFKQAQEYEKSSDIVDSVHKLLNLMGQSHPFPVLRLTELKTWVDSGQYQKILDGNYERKTGHSKEDVGKDFENAANQYKEDMSKAEDPLSNAFSNIMDGMNEAGKNLQNFLDNLFKGPPPPPPPPKKE